MRSFCIILMMASLGASCNAPTGPETVWIPISRAPSVIRSFVTAELAEVDSLSIVLRVSEPDATFFVVTHGPPHDCPLCFRDAARGLLIEDRIGWIMVGGVADTSTLTFFDVLPEDGGIIRRSTIRMLSRNSDLLFHTLDLFAEDLDTPDSALITIASSLNSRDWPDIGETLLDNENARENCEVLSILADLERFVYREVRQEAAELLADRIASGRCQGG